MKLLILTVIISSAVGVKYAPPKVNWTTFSLDDWWGPEDTKDNQNTSIVPASIEFTDEMITDLRYRLNSHVTFKPPLKDSAFTYGFSTDAIDYWIKYWAEQYDFKKQEKELNKYPQYRTNIQGLNLQFIWYKPKTEKKTVPLLLLHGWPGSIREFYETIPFLTTVDNNREFSVEVIVPFMPGFGFSDGAVRPGLGAVQIAIVMRNLMKRLGFDQFFVQGGDAGTVVANHMATLFATEVLGFHTNIAFFYTPAALGLELVGSLNPSFLVEPALADRMYPLLDTIFFLMEESGYLHIQATKPDTVGVALTDSPSGLLAYILEKFSTTTNRANKLLADGGLKNTFTPDQLIDILMMHWVPRSITTSMRLYAETFNKKQLALKMDEIPTPVPTCVLQGKHELAYQPPLIIKMKYSNLLNATPVDFGGHFFAFEEPKFFADSVLSALSLFIDWHTKNEIAV